MIKRIRLVGVSLSKIRDILFGSLVRIVYLCIGRTKNKNEVMKKVLLISMGVALLLSSCGSYTATGAYVGGEFGNVVGSAIGGIAGGHRGHHLGSLIGTVGGVVAGAAIGAAVDNSQQDRMVEEPIRRPVQQHGDSRMSPTHDNSGFDPGMHGDDRIAFDDMQPRASLEIRNARIDDGSHDGMLTRGEECTVVFDIMNVSASPVYDINPLVVDVTGNKHVKISPNLHIESIMPYQGMRYKATVKADNRLKDGQIVVRVSVVQRGVELSEQAREFTVPTRKK